MTNHKEQIALASAMVGSNVMLWSEYRVDDSKYYTGDFAVMIRLLIYSEDSKFLHVMVY